MNMNRQMNNAFFIFITFNMQQIIKFQYYEAE